MPPRPRGERGGDSAKRKKRREERILLAGLISGLQWFLTQACLNPVPAVEPAAEVIHPTRAPVRPSQSSRPETPPAAATTPAEPSAPTFARPSAASSHRSAPVEVASDSEDEPQFVGEVAVQVDRLRLLVPNPRNLAEGISVHRLDELEGFYQICRGTGCVLVNSASCPDVNELAAGLQGALILDVWQTLVVPTDWVRDGVQSISPHLPGHSGRVTKGSLEILGEASELGILTVFVTFVGRNNLES